MIFFVLSGGRAGGDDATEGVEGVLSKICRAIFILDSVSVLGGSS